jgi:hypothetical protein
MKRFCGWALVFCVLSGVGRTVVTYVVSGFSRTVGSYVVSGVSRTVIHAQTPPKQAVVETSGGTFVIDLAPDAAPNQVAYFMKQAQ